MAERVALLPITDDDVDDVALFLHDEMNGRVAAEQWAAAMRAPWQHEPPNHGVHLRTDEGVVGAYLALYSYRDVEGNPEHFCNLAAWCVREQYRFKGLRLLNALLAQQGYHFVDLSPSGNVIALNERLGFKRLDTATALVPNLPWPTVPRRVRVVTDPAEIERTLTGRERDVYRDHADAPATRHLLVRLGSEHCYLMYRRDRRKNMPFFATVLYVSDRDLFRRAHRPVMRHLLCRHGIPATLAELRVTGHRIRPSMMVPHPRPKMFRSNRLTADQIDDLYSELTAVAW